MSTLDLEFDLDSPADLLELEWQQAFEAGLVARANFRSLAAQRAVDLACLDEARERFERCEAHKSQILTKIDRWESRFLGWH